MATLFSSKREQRLLVVIVALAGAYFAVLIFNIYNRYGYLPGDCYFYRAVVESIVNDGDIYLENNILPQVIQGNTALSIDNRIVPKHTVLLPVFSLPFYLIWGEFGLFLFNCAQFGLLVFLVFKLNEEVLGRRVAFFSTTIVFLGSYLPLYIPNFSPDIFATNFILAALLLLQRGRGLLGLSLAALSVFVKVYNAVPLAFLGLFYVFLDGKFHLGRALKGCAAVLLGLLPMFVFDYVYFGDPLVGGYSRTVGESLAGGGWTTLNHTSLFNLPLWPGLWNILFDPRSGYISSASVLIGAAVGMIWYFSSKHSPRSPLFIFTILINVTYILMFAKYYYWNMSNYGNRFLMLPLVLSSLFIGYVFIQIEAKVTKQKGN